MEKSHNTVKYEIVREDSQYNKRIKWYLKNYRADGSISSSLGFKTRREAEEQVQSDIYRGEAGFHIGNRIAYTEYVQA